MRSSSCTINNRPGSHRIGFLGSLALSLAAMLAPAGCSPQDVEEFLGAVRDSTSPPIGAAVPFETFTDDVGARSGIESRVLIRNQQGYQDFFGHVPPAVVDFSTEWVIFYSAGTKPTGGYDANILSLTRSGRTLAAVTELVSPGADCITTQALTEPYVLIKFVAQPGAAVDFTKKDAVHDCGPTTSPCAAVLCGPGTHCEAHEVQCVRAPCPPVGTCVPDATVVRCGGFAGLPCPGNGKCSDDPSDSCDPSAGGADCGGICQCVQNVLCIQGDVFDNSPKVCACVPQTTCGPVCQIFCAYGNVLDDKGCPTCKCKSAP
jgi:hypothetical protein